MVAGLRVARSLRAYEAREATAPSLPQYGQELEEEAGAAPAAPRNGAARLATECGYLTIRVSSECGGGDRSRTCPPVKRRLASNERGLPLPNASVNGSGSPSETRTRICSVKGCRPALSRWGPGGRDGTRTRIFLVHSPMLPAAGEGALP